MKFILTNDTEGNAVYAVVINGHEIVDPYLSECGRFDVTPDYYGLSEDEAQQLMALNQSLMALNQSSESP